MGSWEKYRPVTFSAFCRRSGYWRQKKGEDDVSWNERIQSIFVDRLAEAFNTLDDDIVSIELLTIANVGELYSSLKRDLEGMDINSRW